MSWTMSRLTPEAEGGPERFALSAESVDGAAATPQQAEEFRTAWKVLDDLD